MTAPELQQEIERTRERLGATVDELVAKADVKSRARARAAQARARAQGRVAAVSGRVRRSAAVRRGWPFALAGAVLAAGSAAVWQWRKA
jgi:Protein of unknown function (DUF3618)